MGTDGYGWVRMGGSSFLTADVAAACFVIKINALLNLLLEFGDVLYLN